MNNDLVYIGILCESSNNPLFHECYEEIRDEFFSYIESADETKKKDKNEKESDVKAVSKVQKFCHSKKATLIKMGVGLAILTSIARKAKKEYGSKKAEKLMDTINKMKNDRTALLFEIEDIRKDGCPKFLSIDSLEEKQEQMQHKIDILVTKYQDTCKLWHVNPNI